MSTVASPAAAAATIDPAVIQAERDRCMQLTALAAQHGMQASLDKWIKDGASVQVAQLETLTHLKANSRAIGTYSGDGSGVVVTKDAEDKISGSLRMMRMGRCVGLARHAGVSLVRAAEIINDPVLKRGFEGGFSAMAPNQGSVVTDGGATIPEVFSADFVPFLRPKAVVRSFGPRAYPLINGNLKLSKATSGAIASYIGEAQKVKVTKAQLGNVKFSVKKLGATLLISNDLLRYSGISVDEQLRNDAARGVAQAEDTAFVRSQGTEWTPKGLLYQAAAANKFASSILKAKINAPDDVTQVLRAVQADFGNLFLAIANANIPMENMGIVMSKRTEYFFKFQVRDGLGRLVLGEEMAKGTLFGVPYKSTTVIPNNLGATGYDSEIYLADFDQVVVADAPVMSVAYTQEATVVDEDGVQHNLFQEDLTGIRFIEEHDMGVLYDAAIAVLTGVQYGA